MFASYFEHTSFLYEKLDHFDFHFSFYMAVVGIVCTLCGAVTLIIGDEPSSKDKKYKQRKQEAKRRLQQQMFEAHSAEYVSLLRQSQTEDSGHHSDVESYIYQRPLYSYVPIHETCGWSDGEDGNKGYRLPKVTPTTAQLLEDLPGA